MSVFGYIDIENNEIQKYFDAVQKKVGTCEILPSARFYLSRMRACTYGVLVCSEKMGDRRTGIGAENCNNCLIKNVRLFSGLKGPVK